MGDSLMRADLATLLDVEEDWDVGPPGRFCFPFLFAIWVDNIPIIISPALKFGLVGRSDTGAVVGVQVRSLAIYNALDNIIAGRTSSALFRDAVRHFDFGVLRARGVRRLRTRGS